MPYVCTSILPPDCRYKATARGLDIYNRDSIYRCPPPPFCPGWAGNSGGGGAAPNLPIRFIPIV